jgi:hypothetical protein
MSLFWLLFSGEFAKNKTCCYFYSQTFFAPK